jgi:putative transposase
VVWNDCLRARKDAYAAGLPFVKSAELSKLHITQAKRTEERAWLADVSAVVLQQSLRDLDTAYKNFFDGLKGKRAKMAPPQYKSKKDTQQSIRFNTNAFSLQSNGTVYVAKVGNVRVKWSRTLSAAPTSMTLAKGLGHFAVLADGTKVDSPRFLRRAEKNLREKPGDMFTSGSYRPLAKVLERLRAHTRSGCVISVRSVLAAHSGNVW